MSEEWFKEVFQSKEEYVVEKVGTKTIGEAEITIAKVKRGNKEIAIAFVYDKSGLKKRQSATQNALIVSLVFDDKELGKWIVDNYNNIPAYDGEGVQSERALELFKYLLKRQLPPTTSDP